MAWLDRLRRAPAPEPEQADVSERGPVEGSVPGAAWILGAAFDGEGHSVLDLGPATESSLRVYSRLARRVRFADLFAGGTRGAGLAALDALPPQPDQPYDLVFAWNILDWLSREEGARVISRLVRLTSDDARIHLLFETTPAATIPPLGFTFLDGTRVRYEGRKWDGLTRPPLLPAQVGRLIQPFRVERALTLKSGLREYVATRKPDLATPSS